MKAADVSHSALQNCWFCWGLWRGGEDSSTAITSKTTFFCVLYIDIASIRTSETQITVTTSIYYKPKTVSHSKK